MARRTDLSQAPVAAAGPGQLMLMAIMSIPEPNLSVITAVHPQLFRLPLAEVLADARHGEHTHFELVTATIGLADGSQGTGYTYTGGRGGQAVLAMLRHDLAPLLQGQGADDIAALHEAMQGHVHYVGRGGIASFAISALDTALWDLRGQRLGQPLWLMAGGAGRHCKAYAGGIDLNFPLPKLLDNVRGYLARGFNAVKIKVGQPDLADDVARVAAVRELIGPQRRLMVDANYALTVEQGIAAARAFAPFDLLWFEEPTLPDDYAGFGRIADATAMPLAMGENLHTMAEFELAFAHAKLAYIQPDASNCGGISGWLQVARRAAELGLSVCSHGMQELHVGLLAGVAGPSSPASGWLEVHSFPIDEYTHRPLVVQDHLAVASDEPGTGVAFDWARLADAHDAAG